MKSLRLKQRRAKADATLWVPGPFGPIPFFKPPPLP